MYVRRIARYLVLGCTILLAGCVTPSSISVAYRTALTSSGLPECTRISQTPNCFGTKSYAGGGQYVGEWKDGNYSGRGTYTDGDGTKYVGGWRDGNYSGQGTLTYVDGDKYVGKWKGGQRHGKGAFTYHNGMVKEGIWEKGRFLYAEKPSVSPTIEAKRLAKLEKESLLAKQQEAKRLAKMEEELLLAKQQEAKRLAKMEEELLLAEQQEAKLVSSKQVLRSQESLQELGLYSGKLDGLSGSGTANAIKKWQQRKGLPKTGEVTDLQLVKLELEAIQHLRKTNSEPVSIASVKDIKSGEIKPDKYAGIEFGKFHALVIGIDEYKHLPKLKTAVNDAEAVADVLKRDYGFDVTLLRNAKRSDVMDALDDYEENLGINDNLLIYYAGHGDLDKAGGEGYWHPADYTKKRSSWISNSNISTRLRALKSRHVIVVADSCYSGTLVRSGTAYVDSRSKDVQSLNLKRSRSALTSGGLEQVVDSVGGNHSPFANAFINALNDNKDVVDMSSMYPQIRRSVLMSTDQSPVYSDIRNTQHAGGDFFFVRKK